MVSDWEALYFVFGWNCRLGTFYFNRNEGRQPYDLALSAKDFRIV